MIKNNRIIQYLIRLIPAALLIVLMLFDNHAAYGSNKQFQGNKYEYFKNKFRVNCVNEKITDNFGDNFDSLYGTRNMRTILYGVAYRGGANNAYNKNQVRDNHNPLPKEGLMNLCLQDFSCAVYLYSKNYDDSDKLIINPVNADTFYYLQNSAENRKKIKKLLVMVENVINTPEKGPIYFHCWNGWHQSGYVSALILMQFCNYSNEKALEYWIENTDGIHKGYKKIKKSISTFKPFKDIGIDDKTRKEICPCEK